VRSIEVVESNLRRGGDDGGLLVDAESADEPAAIGDCPGLLLTGASARISLAGADYARCEPDCNSACERFCNFEERVDGCPSAP